VIPFSRSPHISEFDANNRVPQWCVQYPRLLMGNSKGVIAIDSVFAS
jgi:hypothetical protein